MGRINNSTFIQSGDFLYQIGGRFIDEMNEYQGNRRVFEINLDPHHKDFMVSIQLE